MRLSTAFLATLLLAGASWGAAYYVDARDGSDAYSGLYPDSAWQTFARVNSLTLQPGDSLLLRGGRSWNQRLAPKGSGTAHSPIVIGAWGGGRPVIDAGGAEEAILLRNQAFMTVEGLEITNRSPSGKADRIARGIHVFADQAGSNPGIVIRNNFVHDVEGWVRNQRWRTGAIFVRAMHAQGRFDTLLIENNVINNCSVRGIQIGDGQTVDSLWHRNLVIRGNTVDNVGMEGIMVSDAQDILIERNTVYRSGNYLLDDNLDSVCIAALWSRGKNTTIQFNEVAYTRLSNPEQRHMMDSQAFDVDLHTPGYTIIQYNYSHHNEGGFFLFMGDPGPQFTHAIVRYNISVNDGLKFHNRTFEIHSHANGERFPVYVYNNTFYSDSGIGVLDRMSGAGVHPGWEFRNNIFYAPKGTYDDTVHITYDNNLYWNHTPAGGDRNAYHIDPLLVAAGTLGDGFSVPDAYRIDSRSPARAVGMTIEDNGGSDFFGTALQAGAPDIGACQVDNTMTHAMARLVQRARPCAQWTRLIPQNLPLGNTGVIVRIDGKVMPFSCGLGRKNMAPSVYIAKPTRKAVR